MKLIQHDRFEYFQTFKLCAISKLLIGQIFPPVALHFILLYDLGKSIFAVPPAMKLLRKEKNCEPKFICIKCAYILKSLSQKIQNLPNTFLSPFSNDNERPRDKIFARTVTFTKQIFIDFSNETSSTKINCRYLYTFAGVSARNRESD